jgi:hypothetical protein
MKRYEGYTNSKPGLIHVPAIKLSVKTLEVNVHAQL